LSQSSIDRALLHELHLLTAKPFLYVFNVDAAELADTELRKKLSALVAPAEAIFLDAKTEAELAELPDEDALELLQAVGLQEPGLATLARVGFATLGLQTYLTAGPKEARAWTIHQGDTTPQAAGVIHTDFQKGFIKAEIISFNDLIEAGSMTEAKAKGQSAHGRQGIHHARLGDDCGVHGLMSNTHSNKFRQAHLKDLPQKKREDSTKNVAIIAHVDHGKTTLVDAMLWQLRRACST
jgi:ribosome-binding ATPase YchF (GTP1/OBG family)